MSKQKTFDFSIDQSYTPEDFIVSISNLSVWNTLKEPVKWPNKRLIIIGEEGCGKSHLMEIWHKQYNAIFIKDFQDISEIETTINAIIFENIEKHLDEKYLFHLINFCNDHSIYLVMTGAFLPILKLNDLQSRINATYKVLIKPPDETLLKIILLKNFSDRQLIINDEIIDYIFAHTERSYSFIKIFVEKIDKLSLAQKRKITIPLIREVLMQKDLQKFIEQI